MTRVPTLTPFYPRFKNWGFLRVTSKNPWILRLQSIFLRWLQRDIRDKAYKVYEMENLRDRNLRDRNLLSQRFLSRRFLSRRLYMPYLGYPFGATVEKPSILKRNLNCCSPNLKLKKLKRSAVIFGLPDFIT